MEAVRHRQAAQDLASASSPTVVTQSPSSSTSRDNKTNGFQQWYQQVKSARPGSDPRKTGRHSTSSFHSSADGEGLLGFRNPLDLPGGSSSRDPPPRKTAQQHFSTSLSESSIPRRTASAASEQRHERWPEEGGEEGEEEAVDSKPLSGTDNGHILEEGEEGEGEEDGEEEDERTGISLLDATAAAAAQMKLAMTEQVAADASSYQAALRLLDKKDPKAEITSVPKALKILQVRPPGPMLLQSWLGSIESWHDAPSTLWVCVDRASLRPPCSLVPALALQVCADLRFDEGMNACLRYLEAVPWSQNEETEVQSVLKKLSLDETKAGLRVTARLAPSTSNSVYSVLKNLLAQAVAPPSPESMGLALTATDAAIAAGSTSPGTVVVYGSSQSPPVAVAGSKKMWRGSVEKLFVGAKLKADVRKRVLFEQLDALIDRVQACVTSEETPKEAQAAGAGGAVGVAGGAGTSGSSVVSGQGEFVDMAAPSAREAAARFRVEMDNLAWLMGTMVEKLGFAEYIVKWLSEDAGFVRSVEYYSHRDKPVEASMYEPLLPILLRLLTLMVGGHILVPTVTRFALLKLWLPVLFCIPRLPSNLTKERGKLFGELLGQLIITLPMAQQEDVLDAWLSRCGGCYNTWLDMASFAERWLERASKTMRE